MRIYDRENKRVLREVTLYLTPDEARRLASAAADLAKSQRNHHHHVNNDALTDEIIVTVYTPENIHTFDEEARRLLENELE